jgi:Uma2 family endonuclease
MATLTLELPPLRRQTGFNLRRWAELCADPELQNFEGRIETDRHGHIIMTPPAEAAHGESQSEIVYLLRTLLPNGRVITECPISTADGIKVADVAWASRQRVKERGQQSCYLHAPEICVEVISPSNTKLEIQEKMALYFLAGAKEVWMCSRNGTMSFFTHGSAAAMKSSPLCLPFPKQIRLP